MKTQNYKKQLKHNLVSFLQKYFAIITLIVIISVFFIRLFFPPSLFVTPDFGRSDFLHAQMPSKLLLSQSLKNWELPVWSSQIGQGYPVGADGIMGTYYVPNFVIFGLLPPQYSFPTTYLITFLIAGLGMYFLIINLSLNRFAAVFGSIAYTFSASMILHVQHINLIQSASLLPWIALITFLFFNKINIIYFSILAILLAQLFFAGFVQIFAYTLFFIFLAFVAYGYLNKNHIKKTVISFVALIFTVTLLSSIQLFPTYELISKSQRSEGLPPQYILDSFPLSFRHFKTYLNPFILGSAKDGTYNSYNFRSESIYWEITSYIGLLPILLGLYAIYLTAVKRKVIFVVLSILLVISISLSLGKLSPSHIIFSFPPFNYFRVPARFILFNQLFLAIFAAYGFHYLFRKSRKLLLLLGSFLIFITIFDLYSKWWSYNPIGAYDKWTSLPQTADFIRNNSSNFRIIFISNNHHWNEIFTKYGWENHNEDYYFFKNSLDPNQNVISSINQFSMFEDLSTARHDFQKNLLDKGINIQNNSIELNTTAVNILSQSNVKYFLSSYSLVDSDLYKKVFEVSENNRSYYIYENNNPNMLFKIYYDYELANKSKDYINLLNSIDISETVILENNPNFQISAGGSSVQLISQLETSYEFNIETTTDGIFVLSVSNYPGWVAKIDNVETEIIPANINSQAIIIPAGSHKISFKYESKWTKIGAIVSFGTLILLISFLLNYKRVGNKFLGKKSIKNY